MIIETEDYTTWITDVGVVNDEPCVDYENTDGKKWKVYGRCNACGMCENHEPEHFNIRYNPYTKQKETYTRYFTWLDKPGVPGACVEKDYDKRKDIPMTPDCINAIKECVMRGEWIKNGN